MMKKLTIDKYIFYYEKTMIYFYDKRYNNILFLKRINDDREKMNKYDGAQLMIDFVDEKIIFHPIWNIKIEVIDDNVYKLRLG
ncbi:hypothetical protein [Apilactobacillus micheneri]|nr:hypothetical protein [Apilactobacillus micheneri]